MTDMETFIEPRVSQFLGRETGAQEEREGESDWFWRLYSPKGKEGFLIFLAFLTFPTFWQWPRKVCDRNRSAPSYHQVYLASAAKTR